MKVGLKLIFINRLFFVFTAAVTVYPNDFFNDFHHIVVVIHTLIPIGDHGKFLRLLVVTNIVTVQFRWWWWWCLIGGAITVPKGIVHWIFGTRRKHKFLHVFGSFGKVSKGSMHP